MRESHTALQRETRNLVQALSKPQVRGQWGEIALRRLVELAGMTAHCDFEEQVHVVGEDGALRPDMVVHLPEGHDVVVDVKTPLDAYLAGRRGAYRRSPRTSRCAGMRSTSPTASACSRRRTTRPSSSGRRSSSCCSCRATSSCRRRSTSSPTCSIAR